MTLPKDWDTDKIIGTGLIVALLFYFLAIILIVIIKETILPLNVAGNIITGLAGYMGRDLIDKKSTWSD